MVGRGLAAKATCEHHRDAHRDHEYAKSAAQSECRDTSGSAFADECAGSGRSSQSRDQAEVQLTATEVPDEASGAVDGDHQQRCADRFAHVEPSKGDQGWNHQEAAAYAEKAGNEPDACPSQECSGRSWHAAWRDQDPPLAEQHPDADRQHQGCEGVHDYAARHESGQLGSQERRQNSRKTKEQRDLGLHRALAMVREACNEARRTHDGEGSSDGLCRREVRDEDQHRNGQNRPTAAKDAES